MPVIEITKENFESEIKNSSSLAVLDFWGPKCIHCAALMPKYHELSEHQKYQGKIKFCSVDTSSNRRVAMSVRPAVMSLPSFIFFRNGEEVSRLTGNKATIESITSKLEDLIFIR